MSALNFYKAAVYSQTPDFQMHSQYTMEARVESWLMNCSICRAVSGAIQHFWRKNWEVFYTK